MSSYDRVVHAPRELVDALDRRVAHVERLGETRIAREAAGLREEALHRIQELTAASSDRDTRQADRSDNVMTDDGTHQGSVSLAAAFGGAIAANDGARHNPSRSKCARMTS